MIFMLGFVAYGSWLKNYLGREKSRYCQCIYGRIAVGPRLRQLAFFKRQESILAAVSGGAAEVYLIRALCIEYVNGIRRAR
jgi:hypothetical protein